MKKHEKLTLIEGHFTDMEAKEILMNIFSAKIHFHETKNFSLKERFGKEDNLAKKRIRELKIEIKKILKIISEAQKNNKKLAITSEINITPITCK